MELEKQRLSTTFADAAAGDETRRGVWSSGNSTQNSPVATEHYARIPKRRGWSSVDRKS